MQTQPKEPSHEVLESLLQEKSEAEKRRVWEIVSKTQIPPDDPMFLVLVAMGTIEASMVEIPRALERREEVLSRLAQVLEEQSDDLERVSNDIVNVSKKLNGDLERMVKIRIPQASHGIQPKLKELLLVGTLGILFGTVFGRPLMGFLKQGACQINSSFCSAAQVSK